MDKTPHKDIDTPDSFICNEEHIINSMVSCQAIENIQWKVGANMELQESVQSRYVVTEDFEDSIIICVYIINLDTM